MDSDKGPEVFLAIDCLATLPLTLITIIHTGSVSIPMPSPNTCWAQSQSRSVSTLCRLVSFLVSNLYQVGGLFQGKWRVNFSSDSYSFLLLPGNAIQLYLSLCAHFRGTHSDSRQGSKRIKRLFQPARAAVLTAMATGRPSRSIWICTMFFLLCIFWLNLVHAVK